MDDQIELSWDAVPKSVEVFESQIIGSSDEHDGSPRFAETAALRQGLKQRHVQMISIAGTIGTGLFLILGQSIAIGGPLGALLGYTLVGCLLIAPVFSVAELSVLVPLSGGITRHAKHFVDPALAFAQGWNAICSYIVGIPTELVAAAVLVQFWNDHISSAAFVTVFGVLVILSNVILVQVYGELEFVFAHLKILLIIGINIMALVLACGGGPDHHTYGFQYWNDPGPFTQYLGISGPKGRFLGFWSATYTAVIAYGGIQNITLVAAETRDPGRSIPTAAKRVFVRIALFYVLTFFMMGLVVPSDDPNLLRSSGKASQSPLVIAANRAGIKVVPSIINSVVLTSAWSSGNSLLFNGSRVLYGLAQEGLAFAFFKRTSRLGIPWVATASTVFRWLRDLAAVSHLVDWIIICTVYLRFYKAAQKQGISRDKLPWKAPWQPYLAWTGLVSFVVLLVTGGYATFLHGHWSSETFVSSYIGIPIVLSLGLGYKVIKRTTIIPLQEVPIDKFLHIAKESREPPEPKKKGWARLQIFWG